MGITRPIHHCIQLISVSKITLALIFEVNWIKIGSVDDVYMSMLDNKWSKDPCLCLRCDQSCNSHILGKRLLMGHQGLVDRRVWGAIRMIMRKDFGDESMGSVLQMLSTMASWAHGWGLWLEGLQAADSRGAFLQKLYVTREHKKCHVVSHVTKYDQHREGDILLPSWGAQGDLSVLRTLEERWWPSMGQGTVVGTWLSGL